MAHHHGWWYRRGVRRDDVIRRIASRPDVYRWYHVVAAHAAATRGWPAPMDAAGTVPPDMAIPGTAVGEERQPPPEGARAMAERIYRMRAAIARAVDAWRGMSDGARDRIASAVDGGRAAIDRWVSRAERIMARTAWAAGAGVTTAGTAMLVLIGVGLYVMTRRR